MMRCAVIGDPASHSLSPAIHTSGYAAVGLDWRYESIDVTTPELSAFIARCQADPNWAGLSVTAPHKDAIVEFGAPDEPTRLLGCGNTLVFREQPLVRNTDVPGFALALERSGAPTPRRVAIVGNGATARSIVFAVARLGARELVILARNVERAAGLRTFAASLGLSADVQEFTDVLEPVDLLASTVPALATEPHARRWAECAATVFDVVYDPWPTPLGVAASALHRRALSGLDLLAGQAVDQFFWLTGQRVTFEMCLSAAEQELRRRETLCKNDRHASLPHCR